MNTARFSGDGHITIPIEIRRILGLKSGDRVIFIQDKEGRVMLENVSANAIHKAQKAFEGAAEAIGVKDDEDVLALIDEIRYGKII